MLRYVVLIMGMLIGGHVSAHQFTPTYPRFEVSFVEGVVGTKMELFNKRKEIEYYDLNVYDGNWNPIPFASESKLIHVNYLETKRINVYLRNEDLKNAVYICTESKIKKQELQITTITSKICSKVK